MLVLPRLNGSNGTLLHAVGKSVAEGGKKPKVLVIIIVLSYIVAIWYIDLTNIYN